MVLRLIAKRVKQLDFVLIKNIIHATQFPNQPPNKNAPLKIKLLLF